MDDDLNPAAVDGLLAQLLNRPAWHADAACAEHPELSWFPGKSAARAAERAKAICAGCLVRDECTAYALDQGESLHGIWGGLSPLDRRRLRRQDPAA